jgi:hypothetical protein
LLVAEFGVLGERFLVESSAPPAGASVIAHHLFARVYLVKYIVFLFTENVPGKRFLSLGSTSPSGANVIVTSQCM